MLVQLAQCDQLIKSQNALIASYKNLFYGSKKPIRIAKQPGRLKNLEKLGNLMFY